MRESRPFLTLDRQSKYASCYTALYACMFCVSLISGSMTAVLQKCWLCGSSSWRQRLQVSSLQCLVYKATAFIASKMHTPWTVNTRHWSQHFVNSGQHGQNGVSFTMWHWMTKNWSCTFNLQKSSWTHMNEIKLGVFPLRAVPEIFSVHCKKHNLYDLSSLFGIEQFLSKHACISCITGIW